VTSPPDPARLARLVELGCFAANPKVIAQRSATGAEQTRIAIHAALHALTAEGYVTVADPDTWPAWFAPDGGPVR
jgi:hypothetical protein